MSTLKVSTLQNLSGTEVYTCKAWVNFNGTGTVAIRASGNVSSITDGGVGVYTVNFTTALPDANYAVVATASSYGQVTNDTFTTSSFRFLTANASASGLVDLVDNHITIFR